MDAHRRNFIAKGTATALAVALPGGNIMQLLRSPEYGDTAWVWAVAGIIREADMVGGGGAVAVVDGERVGYEEALRLAGRAYAMTMDARCSTDHMLAVGYLASVVGFRAYDQGDYKNSDFWYNAAFRCARAGSSESLEARVQGQRARQAITQGQPSLAIGWLEQALVLNDLSGTDRAMLYALLARAYGVRHDVSSAELAMHEAKAQWEHKRLLVSDVKKRPWVQHFDRSHLLGDLGAAAMRGAVEFRYSVRDAAGMFYEAADTSHAPRSEALQRCEAAVLECVVGDLDRGVTEGHNAVLAATNLSSQRVRDRLAALGQVAGARDGNYYRVVELQEELRYAVA